MNIEFRKEHKNKVVIYKFTIKGVWYMELSIKYKKVTINLISHYHRKNNSFFAKDTISYWQWKKDKRAMKVPTVSSPNQSQHTPLIYNNSMCILSSKRTLKDRLQKV